MYYFVTPCSFYTNTWQLAAWKWRWRYGTKLLGRLSHRLVEELGVGQHVQWYD
jgi:hypothetical protein